MRAAEVAGKCCHWKNVIYFRKTRIITGLTFVVVVLVFWANDFSAKTTGQQ